MRSFKKWAAGIVATFVLVALTAGAFLGEPRDRDRFFVSLGGAVAGAVIAALIQRRHGRPMTRTSLLTGIVAGAVALTPFEPLSSGELGLALGYGAGQGALLAAAAAGLWFALQPRAANAHGSPSPATASGDVRPTTGADALRWMYVAIAAAVLLVAAAIAFQSVTAAGNGRWTYRSNGAVFDTRTATLCREDPEPYCYSYRTGAYTFLGESLEDRVSRRKRALESNPFRHLLDDPPAPATMDTGMVMDTMPTDTTTRDTTP
jgi:hypothetical protein